MKTSGRLYIGTSGIVVPVARTDYPEAFKGKSRLSYYSTLLNSLEVNSSFYKPPRGATVERWAAEVDDNFRFTFKIFKSISHAKGLQFDAGEVDQFISLINFIGNKKACILIQFPPSLSIDALPQLKLLLKQIRKSGKDEWHIAVEFRHTSWFSKQIQTLLDRHNACMVIHDLPKSASAIESHQQIFYFRFHGENGRYRGGYEQSLLQQYADTIKAWLKEGKTGYCYFNNTMGDAFANAKTLQHLVTSKNT